MSKPDTGDALPYSFDELIPPYDGSDRGYFRQGTPEGRRLPPRHPCRMFIYRRRHRHFTKWSESMSEELLQNIDAKLGVIVGLIEKYMGTDTKPAAVKVAEQVLEEANAVVEEIVQPEPEHVVYEKKKAEQFAVGDTVRYIGTRIEAKKDGTITEIKTGSPWISVLWEDLGLKSVRQGEITKEVVEQPPALSHEEEEAVEEHLEAQAEASEGSIIKIDEEAAEYKIDKGSFKDYRNIHAIYTDTKKAEANRKYLRFRASKVIGGDETTKEMCHRYLVSVQDEVYMKEVGA